MNPHYSEADLLETYYTQPGESMPVMMHLASCTDCASRYERLERKLRSLDACADEKPESFWSRQRISVMRRIEARRTPVARYAAAATLALAIGGLAAWKTLDVEKPATPIAQTQTASTTTTVDDTLDESLDPWKSDELKDYHSMVAWESWVDKGDQSL